MRWKNDQKLEKKIVKRGKKLGEICEKWLESCTISQRLCWNNTAYIFESPIMLEHLLFSPSSVLFQEIFFFHCYISEKLSVLPCGWSLQCRKTGLTLQLTKLLRSNRPGNQFWKHIFMLVQSHSTQLHLFTSLKQPKLTKVQDHIIYLEKNTPKDSKIKEYVVEMTCKWFRLSIACFSIPDEDKSLLFECK